MACWAYTDTGGDGVSDLAVNLANTDPRDGGWDWFNAAFHTEVGNDDEFIYSLTAPSVGTYAYTFRFSMDGTNWTAADLDGAGSIHPSLTFDPGLLGVMVVVPEPTSVALLLLSGASLLLRRRTFRTGHFVAW